MTIMGQLLKNLKRIGCRLCVNLFNRHHTLQRELYRNPLHLVGPAIVELRGAGRGVVRHRGGVFERAAVFQVGGDAGRAEGVIADLGLDAGGAARRPIIA